MSAAALGNNYGLCVPENLENTESASASKWVLQNAARQLLPDSRVSACHRVLSDHAKGVTVRRDSQKAWFAGLAVCGSVWTCPVCARKIAEKRRAQLQDAINQAIGQGGDVALITLTFSHALYHRIDDLLPKLTKALRKLKSGRAWQAIKREYGIIGSIRALEVTHGNNGWHPHVHELEFFNAPLSSEQRAELQAKIFELWVIACAKVQLGLPSAQHGVDVRGATRAAQYVGKWGFASELARPASKQGWAGRTPLKMLEDYAAGDRQAGALFVEFAEAFAGRRQLVWSRGLADKLALGELLPDELIAECDPDPAAGEQAVDVINIDSVTWAQICRGELRGQLLDVVMKSNCINEIEGWLAAIREKIPIRWLCDDLAINKKMQKTLGVHVSPIERNDWQIFNERYSR